MITEPSCSRLLASVQKELNECIAPELSSKEAKTALAMINWILSSVAIRTECEGAWMQEEINRIEVLAEKVAESMPELPDSVVQVQKNLQQNRAKDSSIAELRAEYNLAGELLSCLLEVTMFGEDELRQAAIDELSFRMNREVHIRGEYSLEGRT